MRKAINAISFPELVALIFKQYLEKSLGYMARINILLPFPKKGYEYVALEEVERND